LRLARNAATARGILTGGDEDAAYHQWRRTRT
jgi:hypothetical protein